MAFWLKEILEAFELEMFAKTSSSKGLQLYVPLNTPVTYEKTKPFAQLLAQRLEREHPRAGMMCRQHPAGVSEDDSPAGCWRARYSPT